MRMAYNLIYSTKEDSDNWKSIIKSVHMSSSHMYPPILNLTEESSFNIGVGFKNILF